MELSIQAKKRQKCFMIDPKDGTTTFVPTFTAQEEQSMAISQLELWRAAGVTDGKDVMDANHLKLTHFQDISQKATSNGELGMNPPKPHEQLKTAIESAQRAAAELSMLVQLTNLISSNKILSLQTCYENNVPAVDDDQSAERAAAKSTTTAAPKVIPLAQLISIQRSSMIKAQSSLQSGLGRMKELVRQRNAFTGTLRTCTEDRGFVLCYVDRKTNRRVLHRKYDPRKDFIAVDCSVTTETAAKESPRTIALSAAPAVEVAAVNKAVSSYVPIHMDRAGLALSESEQNAPIFTIQATLIMRDAYTNDSVMVGSVRTWDVLHRAGSIIQAPDGTATDLTQHFQRRKHETLCKMAFAQLKEELIRGATQWDLLSGLPQNSATQCSPSTEHTSAAKSWSKLQQVLKEETVSESIVVVDVQETSLLLRICASLQLCISLVPIDCNTDVVLNGTSSDNQWVHNTLASMLLQALLGVLSPPVAVAAAPSVNSVNSTTSSTAASTPPTEADLYWSKVLSRKGAGRVEEVSLALDLLKHLKSKVDQLHTP